MWLALTIIAAIDHTPNEALTELQPLRRVVEISCKVAKYNLHQNYILIESELKMADFL